MRNKKYRMGCTDGVSESLGFLLIFTLVIVGIGLVTLYGYPMLLQQQTSADEQIMEKNMIVLQNDVKSLAYKTIPYKETSLKIGGGVLHVQNSSEAPASGSPTSIKIYDNNNILLDSFRSGDLLYSSVSSSTDISLQNGAVVKRQYFEPGSVMLAEPRWFYDGQTETMVINLVNITSTSKISREGVGTVQMMLGESRFNKFDANPPLPAVPTLSPPVYLEYKPNKDVDYSIAWNSYFQKLGMTVDPTSAAQPGDGSGLPVKYRLPDTTTVVIKQYEVNIRSL
ncbi:MAG: hypothetical protein M0Q92_10910 [Methanoregula sp.]|jgi:hypothetical protein|nr:hypothetical protein [Methanoregula sp.]